ncbi:hypothetical protein [Reyranella sp.]|uniref:hypothetical protein n=1 Tax=Reyranella sp. TaxID=1929291 RepID=UPI003D0F9A41
MTKLLTALAKPTTAERSSAEIRADLGKIDMAALGAKVSEIEQARRRLLLVGTDEQLHENGRALADAKLQVERGATLIEELGNLAAAAERREKAVELQAEHEAAQREGEKLAATHVEIDQIAAKLGDLLREASRSCATLNRWNAKAERHAPDRRVPAVPAEVAKRKILGVIQ